MTDTLSTPAEAGSRSTTAEADTPASAPAQSRSTRSGRAAPARAGRRTRGRTVTAAVQSQTAAKTKRGDAGFVRRATRRPASSSPSTAPRAGARPLPIVPASMEEAMALARAVVAARLAPRGLVTPEACMIAILHGLEVGLTPLAALQRITVIDGRPTLWGDGALALVRASGLLVSIEETVTGEDEIGWEATCTVQRRGDPAPLTRSFSVIDAIRAVLWRRPGPWSEYPRRMLQMRARAFALRDAFPDVLGGLYLREELEGVSRSGSWQAPAPNADDSDTAASLLPAGDSRAGRGSGDENEPAPGHDDAPHAPGPHRRAAFPRRRPDRPRGGTWRRLAEVAGPIAAGLSPRTAPPAPPPETAKPDAATEHSKKSPPEPWLTARDLLTDYDNALSCAQDRDTLDEIEGEFGLALARLPEDDRFAAGRILARHEARVLALETGDPA